jgi:hypothetical protein
MDADHREITAEAMRRICEAFAVDARGVRQLTLTLAIDDVPKLDVTTIGPREERFTRMAAALFAGRPPHSER